MFHDSCHCDIHKCFLAPEPPSFSSLVTISCFSSLFRSAFYLFLMVLVCFRPSDSTRIRWSVPGANSPTSDGCGPSNRRHSTLQRAELQDEWSSDTPPASIHWCCICHTSMSGVVTLHLHQSTGVVSVAKCVCLSMLTTCVPLLQLAEPDCPIALLVTPLNPSITCGNVNVKSVV